MSNSHYLTRELVSHSRRVCSLYKRMSRDIEYWEKEFFEERYKKLVLRAKFDQNKQVKDMRQARALLEEAEAKFKREINPYHLNGPPMHPFSKNGISYGRELLSPDYVMDWYHSLEKAQYPYYFAKREAMKDEYIKMWKKKVSKGKDDAEGAGHH